MFGDWLSFMEYNSLLDANPSAWRSSLKFDQNKPSDQTKFEKLEQNKHITKYFYWTLVKKLKPSQAHRQLWEQEIDKVIDEDQWSSMFVDIFKVTNLVKLKDFHYQIINWILVTNVKRAKYSDTSEKCTQCKLYPKTVPHLFCDCTVKKNLWVALEKWISGTGIQSVKFTKEDILLNNYKGTNKNLINLLILLMKRYIYIMKCKDVKTNFISYVAHVHNTYKVEEYDARRNNTIKKHYCKWQTIKQFL